MKPSKLGQATRFLRRLPQRCHGGRVKLSRNHAGSFGEPQRERNNAGEEIGDRFRAADLAHHEMGKLDFALRRRLQYRVGSATLARAPS